MRKIEMTYRVLTDNVIEMSFDAPDTEIVVFVLTRKEEFARHLLSGDTLKLTFGVKEGGNYISSGKVVHLSCLCGVKLSYRDVDPPRFCAKCRRPLEVEKIEEKKDDDHR